jgi:hypothetical protein
MSPLVVQHPMRTSYGKVLPPGTYSLEVREGANGTLDLLFFDTRHILIGLSKAQFRGGGTARSIMPTDKGSPISPGSETHLKFVTPAGSQGMDKQGQGKLLPYIESGSQAKGKLDSQQGSRVYDKDAGEVGSKGGSKVFPKLFLKDAVKGETGASGQPGLLVPAVNARRSLPPGRSFTQLGFGSGSLARFQGNAIIIVGGNPANGEIIAILTPAPR